MDKLYENSEPGCCLRFNPERHLGDDGAVFAEGELPPCDIAQGSGIRLGKLSIGLSTVAAPARLTLTISVKDTPFTNQWGLWV